MVHSGLNRQLHKEKIRLSYDPSTGKTKLWMNDALLGEYVAKNGPKTGRYVIFGSRLACSVKSIRVLRGVVSPGETAARTADDTFAVRFANTDSVSATDISLENGSFVVKTAFGDLPLPVDKVRGVAFPKIGREDPRKRKGDVRVLGAGCAVTLQLGALSTDTLTGSADHLGEVTLRRDRISRIDFHLYDQETRR